MMLPTPTPETGFLRLRPFTDTDAGELDALHSDTEVLHYWDSPPWADRTSVARFMDGCRSMAEEGSGARVAVERRSERAFIGW